MASFLLPAGSLTFGNVADLTASYFSDVNSSATLLHSSSSSASIPKYDETPNNRKQTIESGINDIKDSSSSQTSIDAELPLLQRVLSATVSTFELLVLAYELKFIISNTSEDKAEYLADNVCVEDLEARVTALACWPVPTGRLTDPRPFEWTAVVLGLENGSVVFYTDRGYYLFKEQYSETSVLQIRVELDELLVLYEDCFVILNGLTLLSALKLHRQRVARGAQALRCPQTDDEASQILFRKYALEQMKLPSVIASSGVYRQTLYEQLVAASTRGGFNAYVSPQGRTPYDTFCALGAANSPGAVSSSPFVSFHWHAESASRSNGDLIRQTLSGVANRLTNSFRLPWLSGVNKTAASNLNLSRNLTGTVSTVSGEDNVDANAALATAASIAKRPTLVFQRSALFEPERYGQRLLISPNGTRLALVSDSRGQVSLVDIRKRLLVRVWPCLRDAQFAWLEVVGCDGLSEIAKRDDDQNNAKRPNEKRTILCPVIYQNNVKRRNEKRTILCAVIYAPKRGILEIWSTLNGRRLAACEVDKNGLLLYCPSTSVSFGSSKSSACPVRFLDSALNLYSIHIPYAMAAENRSAHTFWTAENRASFNLWWTEAVYQSIDADECCTVLKDTYVSSMKSCEDLRYLMENVLKSDFVDYHVASKFMGFIIDRLIDTFRADENSELTMLGPTNAGNHELLQRCVLMRQIIDCYALILKYHRSSSGKYCSEAHLLFDFDQAASADVSSEVLSVDDPSAVEKNGDESSVAVAKLAADFGVDATYLLTLFRDLDENMRLRRRSSAAVRRRRTNVTFGVSVAAATSTLNQSPLKLRQFLAYFEIDDAPTMSRVSSKCLSTSAATVPTRFALDMSIKDTIALGDFLFTPFLRDTKASDFACNVLPLLGVPIDDCLDILCQFWLNGQRAYSVFPKNLLDLINTMLDQPMLEQHSKTIDSRPTFSNNSEVRNFQESETLSKPEHSKIFGNSTFSTPRNFQETGSISKSENAKIFESRTKRCRDRLLNSDKWAESLGLCFMMRVVSKRQIETGPSDSSAVDGDWEKVESGIESWDSLMRVLHARLLSETFLSFLAEYCRNKRKSSRSTLAPQSLSTLSVVLSHGAGFVTEEIARSIVANCDELDIVEFLAELYSDSSLRGSLGGDEPDLLILRHHFAAMKIFYDAITLDDQSMTANCSWELIRCWHGDPRKRPNCLSQCVRLVTRLTDWRLQNGLCSLIWHKFLRDRCQALCNALDDSRGSSRPGDRLDVRRLASRADLSPAHLVDFACASCTLLHQICKPCGASDSLLALITPVDCAVPSSSATVPQCTERSPPQVENFLNDFFNFFAKNNLQRDESHLIMIAAKQAPCDGKRVSLHYELCIVILFILENFGCVTEKSPYDLFSDEDEEVLFENLFLNQYQHAGQTQSKIDAGQSLMPSFDRRLHKRRQLFLRSCIVALLSSSIVDDLATSRRTLLFTLCDAWQIDADDLRRLHVLTLYAHGRAAEAACFTPAIEDRTRLAEQLFDGVCTAVSERFSRATLKPTLTPRLSARLRFVGNRSNKDQPFATLKACQDALAFASSAVADADSSLAALIADLTEVIEDFMA